PTMPSLAASRIHSFRSRNRSLSFLASMRSRRTRRRGAIPASLPPCDQAHGPGSRTSLAASVARGVPTTPHLAGVGTQAAVATAARLGEPSLVNGAEASDDSGAEESDR